VDVSTKILTLSATIASSFLSNDYEAFDETINEYIKGLGVILNVDKVYVYKNYEYDNILRSKQQYIWISEDKYTSVLNDISFSDSFRVWYKEFISGSIYSVDDSMQLKNAEEKDFLVKNSIRSICLVPIFSGGMLWGFVGFTVCDIVREWTTIEKSALSIAATIIGNAIYNHNKQELLEHPITILNIVIDKLQKINEEAEVNIRKSIENLELLRGKSNGRANI
jgi:GAF domain-containing protein